MSKVWYRDQPIVRSLLETDVYKIMMMYVIWKHYSNLKVEFGFTNRTKQIRLPKYVDLLELQMELKEVERKKFEEDELSDIASWGMHEPGFINALRNLRLTMPTVEIVNGEFYIVAEGTWFETTLWEIYVLAIVSELYTRGYARKHNIAEYRLWDELNERLDIKIALFKANPGVKLSQFGLRRRFSSLVEDHVTMRLLEECPGNVTGVSNVYLARKYGVEAQGTNAHEMPMALTALARHQSDSATRDAIYRVLELWQREYNFKALIMLDDTYGSDEFREHLPRHFAEDFRGFRHDSGDPFEYGEKVIAYYQKLGIDPREKIIIFSDGLTPEMMVRLYNHFSDRIIVVFGIGTNLTNDLGLIGALSLVMKVIRAAGNPAVKLSNNLNKATGNPHEIEEIKRIFGYTNKYREDVVY